MERLHLDLYRQRFLPVIEFINRNLDKPIQLDDVAGLSHFSKYHFHRIFSGVFGESLGDYIARCRLQAAAQKLIAYPEMNITEVAMSCGYSTSANFTRAFKNHYGVNPKSFRNGEVNKSGKLAEAYDFSVDPERLSYVLNLAKQTESTLQPFAIEDHPSMTLCILQSDNGYEIDSIFRAWKQVIEAGARLGLPAEDQKKFALTYDNPVFSPNQTCKYLAGIVVPESVKTVGKPFELFEIKASTFARFKYQGPSHETYKLHTAIYQQWLPNSGYEPDEHPTIEYVPSSTSQEKLSEGSQFDEIDMEIWLNVKPLQFNSTQ